MAGSDEHLEQILAIVEQSSIEELYVENGDFRLTIRKRGAEGVATTAASGISARPSGSTPPSTRATDGSGHAPPLAAGTVGGDAGGRVAPRDVGKDGGADLGPRADRRDGVVVRAPMLGTFYRAPAPGAPPFVEVGSVVSADDTVCIVEVMKLMNSIPAGCRGRVADICAQNAELVEFGQTLFVIEPLS